MDSQQFTSFFEQYTPVSFQKGERIIREYDNPNGVYFITEGVVRLYLISEEGNELTALFYSAGSILPLRWALDNQDNIYNYQAMNEVKGFRAPREDFQKYVSENAGLERELSKQLIGDSSALIYRLQHVIFGDARAKVASVVLTAARRFSTRDIKTETIQVAVPLTHQQIADSAGITRETASLEMKKLKDEGVISYKGRTLIVENIENLAQAAFL